MLKFFIFFGIGVLNEDKREIKNTFGIVNEGGTSKYLGYFECFSGSKVEMLFYIKDRILLRFEGWYL